MITALLLTLAVGVVPRDTPPHWDVQYLDGDKYSNCKFHVVYVEKGRLPVSFVSSNNPSCARGMADEMNRRKLGPLFPRGYGWKEADEIIDAIMESGHETAERLRGREYDLGKVAEFLEGEEE